jgi:hypothetical protein
MADLGQIRPGSPSSASLAQIPSPGLLGVEGGMAWVAILLPLPLALNSSSFALFFLVTCHLGLFIYVNCSS